MTIDPLTAVTSVPLDSSRLTVTTQFAYNVGTVTTTTESPSTMNGGQLGSLWSSISHALHDALHWLQNVEGDVYKDLASGGVSIVTAVDSITVTVGKDIMKQVNGVEQDLQEVVTTVEEYASVVANLVVTIVESSFIYIFIKTLIALISLFLHFKDILQLSDSLKTLFNDMLTNSNGESFPNIPSNFSTWSFAGQYLGSQSNTDNAFSGIDSGSVMTEVENGFVTAITGNPLTKKLLNKMSSVISALLNEVNPPLPLSFNMDETSAILQLESDISSLEDTVVSSLANLVVDEANDMINSISEDLTNPKQIYTGLASTLGEFTGPLGDLKPVFDKMDEIARNAPYYAQDIIGQDPYITLNITVLVDLCKLFGIGTVSNSKLTLKADEAVFFPLAVIIWVAVYLNNGSSIKSVSDLEADLSSAPGDLGASGGTLWNLARLGADGALTELGGISWFVKALYNINNKTDLNAIEQLLKSAGVYFNFIRWVNDTLYTVKTWVQYPATPDYYTATWVFARMVSACADIILSLKKDTATGWPSNPKKTDITHVINVLLNVGIITYDSINTGESNPDSNQIAGIVGRDMVRSQTLFSFLYNFFFAPTNNTDALLVSALIILVLPYGFEIQILALEGLFSAPPPSGPGNTSPGPGKRVRKRKRPHGTGPKNGSK